MWTYTIRNLLGRKGAVLAAVISVGVAIGGTIGMFALLDGLVRAIEESGSLTNAIVLKRGASSELSSTITQVAYEKIRVAPGVARIDGKEAISAELTTQIGVRRSGKVVLAPFRGVEPIAYRLHNVKVVGGEVPSTGQEGALVGAQLVRQFALGEGEKITVARRPWPILGTLAAPGTKYESEIWTDRTALIARTRIRDYSVVIVQLERPEAIDDFVKFVTRIPDQQLDALSEREYYRRASEGSFQAIRQLASVLALILAIGAIAATTTMVYASFLSRTREIATLLAIGFRRSQIALSVLLETCVLVGAGGALGFLGAVPLSRQNIGMASTTGIVYQQAHMSIGVLTNGLLVILVIGLLGSLLPIVQVYRLSVLSAIRE